MAVGSRGIGPKELQIEFYEALSLLELGGRLEGRVGEGVVVGVQDVPGAVGEL